jgi:type IV pilus assembly protein PilO
MALIPDEPRQRNALLLGILTAALFYFFWAYWYSPRQEDVTEKTAQLERLDQNNRLAQIRVARGGTELEDRLAEYERHVERLEQLIPEDEEVASLLNEISQAARQTGVSDPEMRPEPNEVGAFYTKESYEIEVVGEYHDIGRFLTAIASLPRIITPVDLEITLYDGDMTILDPDLETPLTARLRIQTYILPSETDPPPPLVEGVGTVEGA